MAGDAASDSRRDPGADDMPAETRQFDFWLGEWVGSWGEGRTATNRVRLVLDDRVVLEEFDGRPGTPLRGMSTSCWDAEAGLWRQTWVDNQGSYLEFSGAMEAGRMTFVRRATIDGEPRLQRMVWRDITTDAFDWDWQVSEDGGVTWLTRWQVRYRRA